MTTITVYIARLARDGFRVVAGDHVGHLGSKTDTVHVYTSAAHAYATETRDDIRAAILRIDGTAAGGTVGPVRAVHVHKILPALCAVVIGALASFAHADADYLTGPKEPPATSQVHFKQARAPEQVAGCARLGDFKAPDTAWRSFQRLQKLVNAGMDTALLTATVDGVQYQVAYRCAK